MNGADRAATRTVLRVTPRRSRDGLTIAADRLSRLDGRAIARVGDHARLEAFSIRATSRMWPAYSRNEAGRDRPSFRDSGPQSSFFIFRAALYRTSYGRFGLYHPVV